MDTLFLKKIKFIIKMKLNCNSTSLDSKINTVLGQRRMNGSEILNIFKNKISELKININNSLQFNVWIIVFDLDDYVLYIKMPTLTTLINRLLYLNKNFYFPGYICNFKKIQVAIFHYSITPYMLYEVIKYKYLYENISNISLHSFFKKNLDSLKSKGINILIN